MPVPQSRQPRMKLVGLRYVHLLEVGDVTKTGTTGVRDVGLDRDAWTWCRCRHDWHRDGQWSAQAQAAWDHSYR
jgi:hypothetical protein